MRRYIMKGEREDMHITHLLNELINQTQIALKIEGRIFLDFTTYSTNNLRVL